MTQAGIIVVGSGQGGFQVAASLRDEGYAGPVTLIGEEPGLPYQRPPLSKAFLSGKSPAPQIDLRPDHFYSEHAIRLLAGERVTGIDRGARQVTLASGASLAYDHLVLATGARARLPAIAGVRLAGVLALRSRADAQALLEGLHQARRLVVVGAGFIGLEVAVAARDKGLDVHVLEFTDRVLKRSVSAPAARYRGRFVFVVKSDGRRSSTGVGVACQAIDFIGFPVDFFDRRLRAQKRARFQPPVPVFGVVCDGRISLA